MAMHPFARATVAGILSSCAVAAAVLVTLIVAKIRNPDIGASLSANPGEAFLSLFVVLFGVILSGGPLLGIVIGLPAGRNVSVGLAAGAGAVAALAGYLVVLIVTFLGITVLFEDSSVWNSFGDSMWNLASTAAAGCLAAMAMAFAAGPTTAPNAAGYGAGPYGAPYGTPPYGAPAAPYGGPLGAMPGAPQARKMKCPKCANIVTVLPGARPSCDKCGFSA